MAELYEGFVEDSTEVDEESEDSKDPGKGDDTASLLGPCSCRSCFRIPSCSLVLGIESFPCHPRSNLRQPSRKRDGLPTMPSLSRP
eukprot:g36137.t1